MAEKFKFGQLVEVCNEKTVETKSEVLFDGSYGMVIRAALPGDTFPDGGTLGPLANEVYMVSVGKKVVFYHEDLIRIPMVNGKVNRQVSQNQ